MEICTIRCYEMHEQCGPPMFVCFSTRARPRQQGEGEGGQEDPKGRVRLLRLFSAPGGRGAWEEKGGVGG